jgi:hypothetical protein
MASTYWDKKCQKWNVCNRFDSKAAVDWLTLFTLSVLLSKSTFRQLVVFESSIHGLFSSSGAQPFFHFERTKEKKIRIKKWKKRNRGHFNNHFCYNKRTSPSNFVETDPFKLKECRLQIWNFPVMILPDTLDLLIFQIKWVLTFNLS